MKASAIVALVASTALGGCFGQQHIPVISLSPAGLAFDAANAGLTEPVTVTDIGEAPLIVTSAILIGDTRAVFSIVDLPPLPKTLSPGGSFVFQILYQPPQAGGNDGANLFVNSNDPTAPQASISVLATLNCSVSLCGDAGPGCGDGGCAGPDGGPGDAGTFGDAGDGG